MLAVFPRFCFLLSNCRFFFLAPTFLLFICFLLKGSASQSRWLSSS